MTTTLTESRQPLESDVQSLHLKIHRKNRIITVLAILTTIAALFYLYAIWKNQGSGFRGSVPYSTAYPEVSKFRGHIFQNHRSNGVYYAAPEIKKYLDVYFGPLTQAQTNYINQYTGTKPNLADCEWQVGFAWMAHKDEKGRGVDFCVFPLLVDKVNKVVYDYFDEQQSPFYDRTHKVKIPGAGSNKEDIDVDFVFNTGTMFP